MDTAPSPRAVRSMTGFASERSQTSLGELTVSLRGVNHRGLDLHFQGGNEFSIFENEMRALLKKEISRGHVEVRSSLLRSGEEGQQASFNREVLTRYLRSFRAAAEEFGVDSKPDLNVLLGAPGMWAEAQPAKGVTEAFLPEILGGLTRCAASFNQHREREGRALLDEMETLAGEIERANQQIVSIRGEALPLFRARLREKLGDLLAGSGISENRLIEEAALLADRSDIQEEVVRLNVHVTELQRLFRTGGEIGKKIDFLLQEMNREVNTALAKSANAGEPGLRITNLGLTIKANIERIREQGLNLE